MLHAPNSAFKGIPSHIVVFFVGIELACDLFHGSVVITYIITGEPANLIQQY